MNSSNGAENGRPAGRVNWTTLFAGCGLVLTIGSVVVYALIAQWSVQFSAVHQKIAAEREITELKLKNETLQSEKDQREYFKTELEKAQKQGGLHTGK